jgi:4'-phosphopantetheinyl transferase
LGIKDYENSMAIKIYTTDIESYQKVQALSVLLQKLPLELHARALRYQLETDAYAFVLGRLLLKAGLESLGKGHLFDTIQISKNGKPYIEGLSFSISHTENRVVCAISENGEIGLDIEKIKPIDLQNFVAFFTETEMQTIKAASDPMDVFYRYWTRKESIIKALGTNLAYLHKIEIDPSLDVFEENEKRWYLRDLDFGVGYKAALCGESEFIEADIIFKSC